MPQSVFTGVMFTGGPQDAAHHLASDSSSLPARPRGHLRPFRGSVSHPASPVSLLPTLLSASLVGLLPLYAEGRTVSVCAITAGLAGEQQSRVTPWLLLA